MNIENAKSLALSAGFSVANRTKSSEIVELIKSLQPLDCGRELIRIGGDADGGYLVPDDLDGIEYCFSPGVSNVADFEDHLATLNIRSFLADYSVDGPPPTRHKFTFDKQFLGSYDDAVFLTLNSWKQKYLPGYQGQLLLQMDIEGAEYQVILSTASEVLDTFRIMVIEFHYLDRLFDPFVYSMVFKACFQKLLQHFYVAHIHPNNCCGSVKVDGLEIPRVAEFTFYNKRRVSKTKPRRNFPHVLDRDNFVTSRPLLLPELWYEVGMAAGRTGTEYEKETCINYG
jgi:hypothetical protein